MDDTKQKCVLVKPNMINGDAYVIQMFKISAGT